MDSHKQSFSLSPNEIFDKKEPEIKENEITNNNNSLPQYILNNNQINEKEPEEGDEIENLRFKDCNNNINLNSIIQQRLDSYDSAAQFKFSIDLPNAPEQKLQQYLNGDLLNALDVSPNQPKINNNLLNNKKMAQNENNEDIKNLFNFSLYGQQNNLNNKNNVNMFQNNNMMNNYNKVNMNNNYPNNNINYHNLNYNIVNPKKFFPKNFIKVDQSNTEDKTLVDKNQQGKQNQKEIKEGQDDGKNKFDSGNKKSGQNYKKEGKNKRHFEVRAGDWTCNKCTNLNFSFRNKCNRCGLPKEFNYKLDTLNQNINNQNLNTQKPPMFNGINQTYFYGYNMNNINIYMNNMNSMNSMNNINSPNRANTFK